MPCKGIAAKTRVKIAQKTIVVIGRNEFSAKSKRDSYSYQKPGQFIRGKLTLLSVKGNALRVSEPMCKYRHSEGREKISERDSIIVYLPKAGKVL